MHAEVITVGSEIMIGQTLDTHSQYLSQECVSLGIDVWYHTSVGDRTQDLKEVIQIAHTRSDLVFICGGLGPTPDDLTKEVVSEWIKIPLIPNQMLLSDLKQHFANNSLAMPLNNLKQTLVFQGGTIFPNRQGTAPGLAVEKEGTIYILLPGPPKELQAVFSEHVRSYLWKRTVGQQVILSKSFSFFGIGESSLTEQIQDLIIHSNNPTIATYIQDGEIILRVTARAKSGQEAKALVAPVIQEIWQRVGSYCYSEGIHPLEERVIQQLRNRNETVAVAESCTGGLVTHQFTTIPKSSSVLKGGIVCYTNEVKQDLLQLPPSVLAKEGAVSEVTAKYLAESVQKRMAAEYGLGITGVAGPDGLENQPVGQIYIGLAQRGEETEVKSLVLQGERKRIQLMAAKHALFLLYQRLKKGESTT